MLCVIWVEYQRVPVSVLFFCSIEVCDAHPPKKLSTWYRISPRVSRFCVNPNESTALSVPGLTIELKAHVMCGICGIHANSCRKNPGTGIKSNMLQECRGVSDVAQNYTTQTGFWGVSSKKIFRSVHPALVLFNKGLWNKTKENRNNKERIRRFQSKVQHIWWFLCTSTIMQNTLELVKQICPRLLVSPSFPDLVIHGATPTGIDRDRLATSPGVVT